MTINAIFVAAMTGMNKRILRLAIPNMISNVTIPLLALISMMIAGGLGSETAIAAVVAGATILSFVYWNCAFIRMGTSGMTAQAYGARDFAECGNILVRALVVALGIAMLLLIFQNPIGRVGIKLLGREEVSAMAAQYFFIRVWAMPATITQFAIQGWMIGMQNTRTPMVIAISINVLSIVFGFTFVYRLGMGIEGIAWGILVAEYLGLVLAVVLWWRLYRRFTAYISLRAAMQRSAFGRFFDVNKDIFLRGLMNNLVYTFFPFISSSFSLTIYATNAVLIHLFTLFSYIQDSMGYTDEALVGRFVGARDKVSLRHSIALMFRWSAGIAVFFVLAFAFFWRDIITLFDSSPGIVEVAGQYIGWIIVVPLAGFAPFLMDGIFIGATQTRILRNSMFISMLVFFALFYSFVGILGPTALWLAFVMFIVSRGISQLVMSQGLKGLVR